MDGRWQDKKVCWPCTLFSERHLLCWNIGYSVLMCLFLWDWLEEQPRTVVLTKGDFIISLPPLPSTPHPQISPPPEYLTTHGVILGGHNIGVALACSQETLGMPTNILQGTEVPLKQRIFHQKIPVSRWRSGYFFISFFFFGSWWSWYPKC